MEKSTGRQKVRENVCSVYFAGDERGACGLGDIGLRQNRSFFSFFFRYILMFSFEFYSWIDCCGC